MFARQQSSAGGGATDTLAFSSGGSAPAPPEQVRNGAPPPRRLRRRRRHISEAPGRSLFARLAHRPGRGRRRSIRPRAPSLDCDGSVRVRGATSGAPSSASCHLLGRWIAKSVPGSPFCCGPRHQAIEQLAPASHEGDEKLARRGEWLLERGVKRRFDSNDCVADDSFGTKLEPSRSVGDRARADRAIAVGARKTFHDDRDLAP